MPGRPIPMAAGADTETSGNSPRAETLAPGRRSARRLVRLRFVASFGRLVAGPQQRIGDGFLERVPRCGDDVLVHAHRAPGALGRAGAVLRLDEHAGHRAGAMRV